MLCGNVTVSLIHRLEHDKNQGRVEHFCLKDTVKRGVATYDIRLYIGDGNFARLRQGPIHQREPRIVFRATSVKGGPFIGSL